MITTQDVIDVFDSLEGEVIQVQALKATLKSRGLGDATEVVDAINAAIASGDLIKGELGAIRKA